MLQNHFLPVLQVVWTDKLAMRSILALVDSMQAGKLPGSALGCIDLEYNSSNRRVFEIGMCDVNETPTIDCLTSYGLKALHVVIKDNTIVERRMDSIIERCVQQHHSAHGSMTAKQVADEFRLQGISQETIFMLWHNKVLDLSLLREWLESEGEYGVLRPHSHCILIILYFRRNLRDVKLENSRDFLLSLPIIFPIMMTTRQELYERNHRAIVDAQQLEYMTDVFGILRRPLQDRLDEWLEHLRHTAGRPSLHQAGLSHSWHSNFGRSFASCNVWGFTEV